MLKTEQQKLIVQYRPIESITFDPKNPRVHPKRQIKQIAKSIQTFGFNVPVLVDASLRIIAGHGRVEACKMLGMHQVPTVSLEHLTEAEAQAFLIADNRLTEIAAWDDR